jgi:hypothetical protein
LIDSPVMGHGGAVFLIGIVVWFIHGA